MRATFWRHRRNPATLLQPDDVAIDTIKPDAIVTPAKAANLLGCQKADVDELVESGALPTTRRNPNGKPAIAGKDLQRFATKLDPVQMTETTDDTDQDDDSDYDDQDGDQDDTDDGADQIGSEAVIIAPVSALRKVFASLLAKAQPMDTDTDDDQDTLPPPPPARPARRGLLDRPRRR